VIRAGDEVLEDPEGLDTRHRVKSGATYLPLVDLSLARALYPAPDGTVAEIVGVGRYKTKAEK